MMETVKHFARHFVNVTYNSLHHFGVSSKLVPDTFLVLIALVMSLWMLFVGLVGRQASRKGQSFWYGVIFAFLTTPPIASIFIAFLRPLKTGRTATRKRSAFGSETRKRERVA